MVMGKEKRGWRKLVKKLRRKKIRQKDAQNRLDLELEAAEPLTLTDVEANQIAESLLMDQVQETEEAKLHQIEEMKWIEREKEAQRIFEKKKAEEMRINKALEDQEKRIRAEWEEKMRVEKLAKEELDRKEAEIKEKKVKFCRISILIEQDFNEFLSFLCGDIETPPVPYLMSEEIDNGKEVCPFFNRTGACRFYEKCSRNHPRPNLSNIILIQNFFSHFSIDQSLKDEFDTDFNLEYEDSDLYKDFLEFYEDVINEFKIHGNVIQFKVCCNCEPHLRGNVYVQYENIRESLEAFRVFNGRFYNGRQLSLQFVKIDSWKSAICGLFSRRRNCPKGKLCNFLHVFRNPTKEFVLADNDWIPFPSTSRKQQNQNSPRVIDEKRHSTSSRRKSKSRSRSRESSSRSYRSQGNYNYDYERPSRCSRHWDNSFRNRIRYSRSRSRHRNRRSNSNERKRKRSRDKSYDYEKRERKTSKSNSRSRNKSPTTKKSKSKDKTIVHSNSSTDSTLKLMPTSSLISVVVDKMKEISKCSLTCEIKVLESSVSDKNDTTVVSEKTKRLEDMRNKSKKKKKSSKKHKKKHKKSNKKSSFEKNESKMK